MSKEDRDAKNARRARARELAKLQLDQRKTKRDAAIQKRLDEEAAEETARKAHEARTSDRDRIARGTDRISREAAAAFKEAVGVSPAEFRQALLYDPSRGRGSKSLEAYNAIVRRLEKGEIDKAQALLKTHKGRLKDTAKDGAANAAAFEKKHPRGSSSGKSSDGALSGFSWWLRGGR